ncbi:unnamed protein product [Boreogadus saida]
MLQSKTVDYAKAVELIEALKETLLHYNVGLLGHRPLDGANSVFLFSVLFSTSCRLLSRLTWPYLISHVIGLAMFVSQYLNLMQYMRAF